MALQGVWSHLPSMAKTPLEFSFQSSKKMIGTNWIQSPPASRRSPIIHVMKIKIIRSKKQSPLAKAFAEPLSLEGEVEFRKLIVVEELLQFMRRAGISRSELAARMGVPPSRITKMLSGDSNLTIDTLVRAGRAVGADLHQTFAPEGQKVRWTRDDPVDVHEAFASPVPTSAVEQHSPPALHQSHERSHPTPYDTLRT
ncbi:helix-turn-helix transcriptional regulator [bacterium]|nr:helix-turn-helix transcriptional regulator [bacterium]